MRKKPKQPVEYLDTTLYFAKLRLFLFLCTQDKYPTKDTSEAHFDYVYCWVSAIGEDEFSELFNEKI